MEFMETSVFTRRVTELLSDDAYRELQTRLATRPDQGALIPGCGGLRKLRFCGKDRGTRGGVRIIYYWLSRQYTIYMLAIYAKNEQIDLTEEQKHILRDLVKDLH